MRVTHLLLFDKKTSRHAIDAGQVHKLWVPRFVGKAQLWWGRLEFLDASNSALGDHCSLPGERLTRQGWAFDLAEASGGSADPILTHLNTETLTISLNTDKLVGQLLVYLCVEKE